MSTEHAPNGSSAPVAVTGEEHIGSAHRERWRLAVRGVVQGVGFRPFVYGLATRLDLAGFVGNDGQGVFIEVEGPSTALHTFVARLQSDAPPVARIDQVTVAPLGLNGAGSPTANVFTIVASRPENPGGGPANTLISPDLGICDDCLRELFDPHDRRYRHPFINCTNCGPRFTIIRDVPYDRRQTTMADFAMCLECTAEYGDPSDRRFHAQPNACPNCGPRLTWLDLHDDSSESRWKATGQQPIRAAQRALAAGAVVAVKGIGGFHLACDARNAEAVDLLRSRKRRGGKPFALMASDLATARTLVEIDDAAAALLTSRARPIVLLPRRPDAAIAPGVAPGNGYLGIMLPYTPLHYLLLAPDHEAADFRPPPILVMTSGNLADEPIVTDNDEAVTRLSGLADGFLLHDRPIHVPCDDSVLMMMHGAETPVRRSRGYAPFPIRLPVGECPPILAVGGELKATFCMTKGRDAFMSQHLGDMANLETLDLLAHMVHHFEELFRVRPEMLACDMHPGYLSTRWAREHAHGRPVVAVQHHHAHVAALMAEHGLDGAEPVIGVALDGTGYGDDGAIWGGEVLVADYAGYVRAAHLAYVPLPGGDAAIRRPYRTALAHLHAADVPWTADLPPVAAAKGAELGVLQRQLETGFNCAPTSSMGRLFDAVAALAGVRQEVAYEAQAAMELETLVDAGEDAYAFDLDVVGNGWVVRPEPVIRAVVADRLAGQSPVRIATRFHNGVANLVLALCRRVRARHGLQTVALSGGVFQNMRLLAATATRLERHGFSLLVHRQTPANDGGIALGQAMVARRRSR